MLTCVNFQERTDEKDYVNFKKDSGSVDVQFLKNDKFLIFRMEILLSSKTRNHLVRIRVTCTVFFSLDFFIGVGHMSGVRAGNKTLVSVKGVNSKEQFFMKFCTCSVSSMNIPDLTVSRYHWRTRALFIRLVWVNDRSIV